ncbi:O-methylsterigmatocystin oxidoreductase OS=Aspergillus parasiticus GN=ordA PE=3 SV=1 [Rhizoctonia solani AG-1 IB]|uniref:O-methylsterigmatocystin oxidoreductase n=1 Tax=Thanatephorus cucumeris (strain AG1-IB / isolate 7/3/14) TaxID=1108050 RepID=A0A0B7FBG4_THACB|nr:O-methylsterigmatocystin oxidoreductase OS=Aspergillus parasiticus GN=ordA PE=3 SV=1 [Rhizoctonia solani AG-1 IB]
MSESYGLYGLIPHSRVLAFGVLVLVLSYWDWPGSRRKGIPPGPVPIPILGNLLQLKPEVFYDQIRELNNKYGPLVSLKMGSNNVIIIGGDGSLVRELLDKRGSIYSNRPTEPIMRIASGGDHLLFQQDTEKWRAARKQIVRHYPRTSDPEQVHLQEAESVQLLHDFLHDPEQHMEHSMRYTTSVITCLNYGVRCATYSDPVIHGIEAIMTRIARPPVEHFPFLWYLPDLVMGNWKAKTQRLRGLMDKIYGGLAEIGWKRGSEGLNIGNFAYKLRLNEKVTKLTLNQQAQICGIALEGGSDIVAGVVSTAILALIADTQSQDRARQEIDSIYDEETLPSWSDEQRMPFIRAIVKETLRWRPPLPNCVPHRLEQDDTYQGYLLPKDSTIICSIWAIHSNPERYEDPLKFNPNRFLKYGLSMASSMVQSDPFERDHFAFGAGRRSCPGVQLAEQGIFIAISRLLWAFEFSAHPGTVVNTDQSTFHGSIRRPKKYPLVITPRSERRVETIEREMLSATENVFSLYGSFK